MPSVPSTLTIPKPDFTVSVAYRKDPGNEDILVSYTTTLGERTLSAETAYPVDAGEAFINEFLKGVDVLQDLMGIAREEPWRN